MDKIYFLLILSIESIRFEENFKYAKKRNYVSHRMHWRNWFHFCYVTNESDGAIKQFASEIAGVNLDGLAPLLRGKRVEILLASLCWSNQM